jgi:methylmalonyl-CoA mutase
LREATDAQLARTGARPKIFLANLGPPAAFTAQATFAQNFFEAGGIEALSTDGFSSPDAVADAFAASGARLACLCSSNEIYATHAAPVAAALHEAGARTVYLAGRPDRLADELAGVSYVFAECDALAVLAEAVEKAAT